MSVLKVYVDGIAVIGPGFESWDACRGILAGEMPYEQRKTVLPVPTALPAAERRRCGPIIKLSLAVGYQAAEAAGQNVATLPTVFSASGGDGGNCHEICAQLATDDRLISPTRFHNSVHNAASGYWSIASGSMASSSVLCAHDASFGAGLLEAAAQVAVDSVSTLLIACDTTYPEPLRATRPIPDEFGVGLLLSPQAGAKTLARISIATTADTADRMADAALEQLRQTVPAARSLPLLQMLACGTDGRVVLDYLDGMHLGMDLSPCS